MAMIIAKQECIPVGCVPAPHWPYAGVCLPGGACFLGGVCFPGGCVLPRRCMLPRGMLPGVCVLPGGVCFPGGGIPACTEADPPVNRKTGVKTSLRPVIMSSLSEKLQVIMYTCSMAMDRMNFFLVTDKAKIYRYFVEIMITISKYEPTKMILQVEPNNFLFSSSCNI